MYVHRTQDKLKSCRRDVFMCLKHPRKLASKRIQEAIDNNQMFYSSGTPCKVCNSDERYVNTKGCRQCAISKKRQARSEMRSQLPSSMEQALIDSNESTFMVVLYNAIHRKRYVKHDVKAPQ